MRIFLSYASERHDVAEEIALALRNQGHAVFLDRDDLPPGTSYDDQIRNAIDASGLLVFLISPESVSDGRYTLTELAFARKRWPAPGRRVLPVQIAATPIDSVPNYLKAVTILEPWGNRAAEVAAAVADLGRRRIRWRWPATAGAVAALVGTAVLVWQYGIDEGLVIEALKVERLRTGLLEEGPTFQVSARLRNGGRAPVELTTIELQTNPPEHLRIDDWALPEDLQQRPPRSHADLAFPARSTSVAETDVREWRLCARAANGTRSCSVWQDWRPQGSFKPKVAFALPEEVRHSASTVVSLGHAFALTVTGAKLVQLSEDGTIRAQTELPGEAAALARSGEAIFVATRSPNVLAAYREGSLERLWTREIRFAGDRPSTAFDEPPSTSPVSLAAADRALWLITGGGTGGAVIAYLDLTASNEPDEQLTVPTYQADVDFDLRGMHLVAVHDQIWGAVSDTTPASLYRFAKNAYHAYTGHDFDIVECTSDVTGGRGKHLVIVDCDGAAVALDMGDRAIESVNQLGRLFDLKTGPHYWDTERLVSDGATLVGASNLSDRTGFEERASTTIVGLTVGGQPETLLELKDATTRSLALAGEIAMVVLESATGRREAIVLKLPSAI
jgi:hypothetical protein